MSGNNPEDGRTAREDTTENRLMTRRRLLESAAAAGGAVALAATDSPATGRGGSSEPGAPGTSPGAQLSPRILDEPPAAGPWVELDRAAVRSNLAAVRAQAGGRPVMGVIKTNAYGHGLVPMAGLLAQAGVDALMVVTVDEALALREAGISLPILNYGPYDGEAAEDLVSRGIDQAVYTLDAIGGMARAAERVGERARVQVIIDTGLGRVGVLHREAREIFTAAAAAVSNGHATITGTATALGEDPDFDRVQLGRFLAARDAAVAAAGGAARTGAGTGLDVGTRHAAASAAVLEFPGSHLDMVRPGIMLYGHYPNDRALTERPIELTPALALKAKVAYVKRLQRGDTIGYHRAYVAEREETVATLPIGHSEGYPGAAVAAGGHVEIGGRPCPLVGAVTSNHLEVRIPEGHQVSVGDTATLIGRGSPGLSEPVETASDPTPTAAEVCEWGGVGVYHLMMHISPLLPRVIT